MTPLLGPRGSVIRLAPARRQPRPHLPPPARQLDVVDEAGQKEDARSLELRDLRAAQHPAVPHDLAWRQARPRVCRLACMHDGLGRGPPAACLHGLHDSKFSFKFAT